MTRSRSRIGCDPNKKNPAVRGFLYVEGSYSFCDCMNWSNRISVKRNHRF